MQAFSDNQVALISGGTSGIGFATAELLLKQGWCVVINGRNEWDGQEAVVKLRRISSKVRFVQGDVSKVMNCRRIVEDTVRLFGNLNALVTAAGYYEERLLDDVDEQNFDEMFGCSKFYEILVLRNGTSSCARQLRVPRRCGYILSGETIS